VRVLCASVSRALSLSLFLSHALSLSMCLSLSLYFFFALSLSMSLSLFLSRENEPPPLTSTHSHIVSFSCERDRVCVGGGGLRDHVKVCSCAYAVLCVLCARSRDRDHVLPRSSHEQPVNVAHSSFAVRQDGRRPNWYVFVYVCFNVYSYVHIHLYVLTDAWMDACR